MAVTVGILYPGFSAEDDFPRLGEMLGRDVRLPVHHTVMVEDAHRADALLDWGRADRLAEGAAALAPHSPDAVVWACTSGSFVYGWEGAHEQAARLAESAGVPASSTSLAFARAATALGVRRVGIVATYPDDVTDLFVRFLSDAGFEVVHAASHDIYTAAEVGTLGREQVLAMAAAGDHDAAEALLMPDTALHTVDHVEALEGHVGKPVLTANQVSAWEGVRLGSHRRGLDPGRDGRHDAPYSRLGTLFRVPTGTRETTP